VLQDVVKEFGPILVSMIGRMFREKHGVHFADKHGTSLTKFLQQHRKHFVFTLLKGQEYTVEDVDAQKQRTQQLDTCDCSLGERLAANPTRVPYAKLDHLLVLGDGDFSFSRSLAEDLGQCQNLVTTSFDPLDALITKYGARVRDNVEALRACGARVLHQVDGTKLHAESFDGTRFDFVVFNFPHTGMDDGLQESIRSNRELVEAFLRSAPNVLKPGGEVHVALVHRYPYTAWGIQDLSAASLDYRGSLPFSFERYPVSRLTSRAFPAGTPSILVIHP
jgi:25S rRNA (uracil2634-N3)-methyltransferase